MAAPDFYTAEERLLFVDIDKNNPSITGRHSETFRRMSQLSRLRTDAIMRACVYLMCGTWNTTSALVSSLGLKRCGVSTLRDEVPVTLLKLEESLADCVFLTSPTVRRWLDNPYNSLAPFFDVNVKQKSGSVVFLESSKNVWCLLFGRS